VLEVLRGSEKLIGLIEIVKPLLFSLIIIILKTVKMFYFILDEKIIV